MSFPRPVFLPLPLCGNGLAVGKLGVIDELSSPCLSPSPAMRERAGVRAYAFFHASLSARTVNTLTIRRRNSAEP